MQPNTSVKFDTKSFNRVKKAIKFISRGIHQRKSNTSYASPVPTDIGIQLTRKCNLRCKTCFLWNDKGAFKNLKADEKNLELEIPVFEKMMKSTAHAKSYLYI